MHDPVPRYLFSSSARLTWMYAAAQGLPGGHGVAVTGGREGTVQRGTRRVQRQLVNLLQACLCALSSLIAQNGVPAWLPSDDCGQARAGQRRVNQIPCWVDSISFTVHAVLYINCWIELDWPRSMSI